MISSPNQSWSIGGLVKVGFMKLRVISGPIATPKNHAADEYALESLDGSKFYRFTPHRGCFRCETKNDALNGPSNV